ncbi:DUF4097 family beta strand repeat-containing protein [Lacicoccus alkaliphilus]|uniref:DUF4097 domain-containing protein n=1 Tax=Lacicoccus alkaliphilus DSM 16010 TaxID=1123231 RepID=A0A1M7IZ27_9BACL|nr:DUF4097 family beta strand repeat-containing protein [Salinicoccus alkaliphilus]SHM46094.1 Protein of unknown function [Salinicoccus alkaliphilus DSM 16010]
MTKKDFLRKLESGLRPLPAAVRNEILSEYENHINEGMHDGKSEGAVVESLGDPAAIAEAVLSIEDGMVEEKKYIPMQSNFIREINPKEIDIIDIDGDFLSVEVEQGSKFEMNFESHDGKSDFSHGVDGSRMHFKHKSKNVNKIHFNILGFLRNRNYRSDRLTITWPENLIELKVRTGKGAIELAGLTSKNYDITTELGNINAKDIVGVRGDFRSEMGSITVKNSAFDDIMLKTDMGKVKLEDVGANNQELSTDMGSIDIKNAHPDANINAHTDMGSIAVIYKKNPKKTRIIADSKMGGVANQLEHYVVENPEYTAKFKTSMGAISIH